MLLIYISLFLGVLILTCDIYVAGYKVVLNPFFWAVLLSVLYLVTPSIFVEDFDFYFNWNFNSRSVLMSHYLISIYMFFLYVFFWFFPSRKIIINNVVRDQAVSTLIKCIWSIILFYLVYVVYSTYSMGGFINSFQYDGTQQDPYKIKNLAYLLLFISIYMFWGTKNYLYFIPNILILVLDVVEGSRTTALVALLPIVISVCVYRRKLYIVPALSILLGMSVLGVIRADLGQGEIPWYINGLGEFREVYLTLPLYINNEDYIGREGLVTALSGIGLGILQPVRSYILENITFAGYFIASDIDRGYGLGSNLLIEGLYYGYFGLFLTLMLFIFLLILFYKIISKIRIHYAIFSMSLFVICLRLMVREGLYINLGLMLLILVLYWLPFYYLARLKLSKSEVPDEK